MATVISGQKGKYLKLCNSIFHRTMLHPKFIPAIHYRYSRTTVHARPSTPQCIFSQNLQYHNRLYIWGEGCGGEQQKM